MLSDKNSFKDINSFIDHLKTKQNIVGIVEYGGRTHNDMSIGSDYDFTVIFDKPISCNLTGIHFHIAGIPVDCMLVSVEDFSCDYPSNDFMLVHLNCKILFDRDDITKNILDRIKTSWKIPNSLSDFERNTFRFTFQHILDKLEHRLHGNELFSRYFIFSSFDWFLQCYSRIKGLEIGKQKAQLNYIKNNDVELYFFIDRLYRTNDLDVQYEMLKQCASRIMLPIGGLWAKDEILFHVAPDGYVTEEEETSIMEQLFY